MQIMEIKKTYISFKSSVKYLTFLLFCMLPLNYSHGIVIDRLAAYVDDTAITLSDLQDELKKIRETDPEITEKEVIESMINRTLLIKEAKKIRLDARTDDEFINAYLDIKIKSRLFVKEDEISEFYKKHIGEFRGQDYLAVKGDIEKYLLEKEFNEILKKHLEELRRQAEIKILLTDK